MKVVSSILVGIEIDLLRFAEAEAKKQEISVREYLEKHVENHLRYLGELQLHERMKIPNANGLKWRIRGEGKKWRKPVEDILEYIWTTIDDIVRDLTTGNRKSYLKINRPPHLVRRLDRDCVREIVRPNESREYWEECKDGGCTYVYSEDDVIVGDGRPDCTVPEEIAAMLESVCRECVGLLPEDFAIELYEE